MQGVVERIEKKGKRTALKIGDKWYSTFEPIEVCEGDRVEFSFQTVEKNGRTYRNLKALEVLQDGTKATGAGGENASREEPSEAERIARSVALKCAVEACGPGIETAEVLATAEAFLGFLRGGTERAKRDDGRFHDRTGITDEENSF